MGANLCTGKKVRTLKEQNENLECESTRKSETIDEQASQIELLRNDIQRMTKQHREESGIDKLENCIKELKNENREQAIKVLGMVRKISEYKENNEQTNSQLNPIEERDDDVPVTLLCRPYLSAGSDALKLHYNRQEQVNKRLQHENGQLAVKYGAIIARQVVTLTMETQTDEDDLLNNDADWRPLDQSRVRTFYTPYSPRVKERWFKTLIVRSRYAEAYGCPNRVRIHMYNTQLGLTSYQSEITVQNKLRTSLRPGQKVYYHATDAGSLQNILENGIDLTKTNRPVDFSHGRGFYVTDNFQRAAKWSERVASWMNSTGAIIAFRIDERLRKERPYLSLKLDNDTNRKWWECIVSHFRHGKTSPDVMNVLSDVKFIKGPVAKTSKLYAKQTPVAFDDFIQICICNSDYAKRFGSLQNIAFVMFLS